MSLANGNSTTTTTTTAMIEHEAHAQLDQVRHERFLRIGRFIIA
jgi:hypothetical protein